MKTRAVAWALLTEQDHVFRGMEILRAGGWPEAIIKAIGGHAFYTKIPRETPMERAILAADELTGFVGAPAADLADPPVPPEPPAP